MYNNFVTNSVSVRNAKSRPITNYWN